MDAITSILTKVRCYFVHFTLVITMIIKHYNDDENEIDNNKLIRIIIILTINFVIIITIGIITKMTIM